MKKCKVYLSYSLLVFTLVLVLATVGSTDNDWVHIGLKNSADRTSHTTKLSDTDNFVFVLTASMSGTLTDVVDLTVTVYSPANGDGGWDPTLDKKSVTLFAPNGSEDVTLTIPRKMFLAVGDYDVTVEATSQTDLNLNSTVTFNFTVTALPGNPTVLPKPEPRDLSSDYDVAIKGRTQQIPGLNLVVGWYVKMSVGTEDITQTLSVTNNGKKSDQILLTVLSDISTVTLTSTVVTLEPGISGTVTLTVPRAALWKPAIYQIIITATSKNDANATDTFAVNLYAQGVQHAYFLAPASIEAGLHFEGLNDLIWPSKGTDDITWTLRVTNTGSHEDVIHLGVSGDIGTATVNPRVVSLFPNSDEDITLKIPRPALSAAGTYKVIVTATSDNDPKVERTVTTTITVPGDSNTQTDPSEPADPVNPIEPTQPDLSTHQVVLSEFMFEVGGGEGSLPQWIEVYNNSNSTVNLNGWKLQWKSLQSTPMDTTITFDEDFRIPVQQARLIVFALGRHSEGGNLLDASVYQLPLLHAVGLGQEDELAQEDGTNLNNLITRGGFSIKLTTSQDVLVDQIGTLSGDKKTWQLPECLIEGDRSSLIRRFDKGVPRSGLAKRAWRRAYDAKRLVTGLYYGSPRDLGTPGYRRGKPLPVELSQFSAKIVKDEVVINWTTESELDNAGFNIYRSPSRTKDFQRINPKLIQGAGTTGERTQYQFIDKTAKPNAAYYYRLEDMDLAGRRGILKTYRLRGVIDPTGKHITTWGTLKDDR